jgi:16S rRNA (cytosine1402-N4)-methyltransferase
MDDAGHLPVMLDEVLEVLAPQGRKVLVDCTVGLGGHAEAMLERAGEQAMLIGIDRDESNLLKTKERLSRFGRRVRLFQANFADVNEVLAEAGLQQADAVLADLGVSSTQIDDPARGFSFQEDGPLDMRMGQGSPGEDKGPQTWYSAFGEPLTAAVIVNTYDENDLADLIFQYGEDRLSRRIARAIVRARSAKPLERTVELARIIASAVPRGPGRAGRIHPATRTFQALRIAVNREMESLQKLLEVLPTVLSVGGRAAVIAFHSLEDRQVKRAFALARETGTHRLVVEKPLTPTQYEVERNSRSRSAKLRAMERVK